MASLFFGGLPDVLTAIFAVIALFGVRPAGGFRKADLYLLFVIAMPLLVVIALRGSWTHQGHTLARYVFPTQLAFLFWFARGSVELAGRLSRDRRDIVEGVTAAALVVAYLSLNPAITQVRTLGPWYGHLYHHFDYIAEDNRALRYYDHWEVPHFYKELGAMPEGSVTIVQAPFNFDAPYNPDAFYAQFHRQHEIQGFLYDLCFAGPRVGEVPKDSRFRFHSFVYLDDREAVRRSGARYIVLQRDLLHGQPFEQSEGCVKALKRRYGEPIEEDARLAVFDLRGANR
jgi:hypothetical protein